MKTQTEMAEIAELAPYFSRAEVAKAMRRKAICDYFDAEKAESPQYSDYNTFIRMSVMPEINQLGRKGYLSPSSIYQIIRTYHQ